MGYAADALILAGDMDGAEKELAAALQWLQEPVKLAPSQSATGSS